MTKTKGKKISGNKLNNTNRRTDATHASIFEALETRQLMSVVNVGDFGARPNDGGDDRGAIQRAIDASQPGDTVSFGAGEYNVGSMLTFRSGRTFAGQSGATLKLGGGNYVATVEGNGSNVTITGLKFVGGGIDLGGGSHYSNIKIDKNEFSNVPQHAVVERVTADDLIITNNKFDNVRGYGVIEVYNVNRLNYSYNRVSNSMHGGHILGPLDDVKVVGNYMTGLTDWGIEIQRSGESVSHNMLVADNVVYGFRRAYGNTGGLSVIAEHGINTIVRNNYLRADHDGVSLEEGHMHVGIEAGFDTGEVSGNVIGGPNSGGNFTHYITASGMNMQFRNNKFYGQPMWGSPCTNWSGDTPIGHGTFVETNNSWDRNYASMPAPPPGLGTPSPTPTPTPTPTPNPDPTPSIAAPTSLHGRPVSTSAIELGWTDASGNETGFRVQRKTTRGGDAWATITTLPAGSTSYTDTGLNTSWEYDYRIVSYNSSASANSGQITVQTMLGTPNPTPVPDPVPSPTVAKPTLSGRALSTTEIELNWQDVYSNESGYVIERKSTHGTDPWVKVTTPAANSTRFVDTGLNRTWEYDYKITVFTPNGRATSAVITVQTMLQEPGGQMQSVSLSDLQWSAVSNGVGVPELDTTNGHAAAGDGVTMRLDGQKFKKGLGVHSNSRLDYLINGKYQTFESYIGLDDCVRDKGSVVFQVWGDGRKLYDSGLMTGASKARKIGVNVEGKKQLWLVVNHGGDGRQYDYADWANANLLLAA